jgi:predicted small lipoprotein YifL
MTGGRGHPAPVAPRPAARARAVRGIVLLAVLALAACGRKGPPMVPETRVPAAPDGLAASVGPDAVEISWMNPTRRLDGSRIRDLAVARVYRRADEGDGEPKPAIRAGDAIVGYVPLGRVELHPAAARPPEASVVGTRVRWIDRADLVAGRRYTYVVTASDSTGRTSAPSSRLSVIYITAPAPPAGLQGQPGEQQVTLSWLPPTTLGDGSPVAGAITYEVLRSPGPEVALAPITPTPLPEPRYTDTHLENDRPYSYAVVAIRSDAGGIARSAPSDTIAVTPRDMTPPAPPAGLVAIPSPGTVRLAWNASPEPDVAAYIIYRQGVAGPPARLGRVTAPGTTFTDRDVTPGTYRYRVTALDNAAIPNESPPSEPVTLDVP